MLEEEIEKAQYWVRDLTDKCEEKDALMEILRDKEILYEQKLEEF